MKERRVVNMQLKRLLPLYNETMERLISAYKFSEALRLKTDNGSEFLGEFDKYLKEKGIKQNYISKMPTYKWICLKGKRNPSR